MHPLLCENKPKEVDGAMRTLEHTPMKQPAKIVSDDGMTAKDPIAVREAFQVRQCRLVGGKIVSMDEMVELCSKPCVGFDVSDLVIVLEMIPTEIQLCGFLPMLIDTSLSAQIVW